MTKETKVADLFDSIKVRVTFNEEMLGMTASSPEVHEEFVASKAPDAPSMEEEVAAIGVDEVVQKGMNVFPRDKNGSPIIWNYQWKGYFKDACKALRKTLKATSSKLSAHKQVISRNTFVRPRQIVLKLPEGGEMGSCQRALRGQTPQGETISLANSETVPAGTTCELEILHMPLAKISLDRCIREWLDYGEFGGFAGWRSSGKGVFTYEILEG